MADAQQLLAAAAHIYDRAGSPLPQLARSIGGRGFGGGAEWMRAALTEVRGAAPDGRTNFHGLGMLKYTIAAALPTTMLVLALTWHATWLLPLAVVLFYAIEVRMVFAFPLALDGERQPLRASHQLLQRHDGAVGATATVMVLAATMLGGGFCGRGFVRSWCLGCLAVVLWYEQARCRAEVSSC